MGADSEDYLAHGQNAPQGVEKVHYECRIDIESSDQG